MFLPDGAPDWSGLSDAELLKRRVCDLGLRIAGSAVEPLIRQLHGELDAKGVKFHPRCYLTDEWGCPDGSPVIGVPFYLAHPRLIALERTMMLHAEGEDPEECIRLLRHECGHAVNYAWRLWRDRRWPRVFGSFRSPYPDHYKVRRFSRSYVRHLPGGYAQRHPDEDFAETFAVWLTPGLDWRAQYARWSAIEKLEFVDALMKRLGATDPPNARQLDLVGSVSGMHLTLQEVYDGKRAERQEDFPDVFDEALKSIFLRRARPGARRAASWLRLQRGEFVDRLARWTMERRYVIYELYNQCVERCRVLRLWVDPDSEARVAGELSAFLASRIMNYSFRGTFLGEP